MPRDTGSGTSCLVAAARLVPVRLPIRGTSVIAAAAAAAGGSAGDSFAPNESLTALAVDRRLGEFL